MDWRLKARLDFIAKLHGVRLEYLVATLLEDSLRTLEAISRDREDFKLHWQMFDQHFSIAEVNAARRATSGRPVFDFEDDA